MNAGILVALLAFTLALAGSDDQPSPTVYASVWGHPAHVVGSSTLHSGLFRSSDLGRTWTHLGPANLKAFAMDLVERERGRVLYIAAGNGIHRSLDSGRTWKILTDWRITEVLGVAVNQTDPRWLYAATAFGFWRSNDAGATWSQPDGALRGRYLARIRSTGDGDLEAIAESITNDDTHTTFTSSDHGSTWRQMRSTSAVRHRILDSATVALDVVSAGGTTLAATWGSGVQRLERAGWVASGLDGTQVWSLRVAP